MKWILLVWLCIHFFLLGCELFPPGGGDIVHIGIALSYRGTDVQALPAAINDGAELGLAFADLFKDRRFSRELLIQYGIQDEHGMYRYEGGDGRAVPTKERVIGELKRTIGEAGSADLLIITYSGHGLEDGSLVLAPDNDSGQIFGDDGQVDPSLLLGVEELFSLLRTSRAAVLLILDSCYSGAFVREEGSSIPLATTRDLIGDAYRRYFDTSPASNSRVFVISATSSDHTSFEPLAGSHTHGYFTLALLEGLGWGCAQQRLVVQRPYISSDWLYAYILAHQKIPTSSKGGIWYQHPTISGGPRELVLVNR